MHAHHEGVSMPRFLIFYCKIKNIFYFKVMLHPTFIKLPYCSHILHGSIIYFENKKGVSCSNAVPLLYVISTAREDLAEAVHTILSLLLLSPRSA
jgi:hypothetical protein